MDFILKIFNRLKIVKILMLERLAQTISSYNRQRKWKIFLDLMRPTATDRILDIGFTENEYKDSDNFIEKNHPYPGNLTALGVDAPTKFAARYPQVKAIAYDGQNFPFANDSFDICWSNAVIEHVGDRAAQVNFLKEIKRVGQRAFITTPNRFFPFEVHTRTFLLHLILSKINFDKFLTWIKKDWATGSYMNLLSLSELKTILDQAGIQNYKIIKNKFLFFTLDFVIIF